MLLHFFLPQGQLALKKQPGTTLYQLAEALKVVPALWRQRMRHGRARRAGVLDRLQGCAVRNAAAARSHERRRRAEQPP